MEAATNGEEMQIDNELTPQPISAEQQLRKRRWIRGHRNQSNSANTRAKAREINASIRAGCNFEPD